MNVNHAGSGLIRSLHGKKRNSFLSEHIFLKNLPDLKN
jgi:hypothetical protein